MIEKITDHNLERYDSRLKEWCDRKFFEKGNYGKYETTEEAGAVAFYPAPNTPLEGKVKFSFKETPPASGDKSPTNPSAITGVSSIQVSRTNKNLLSLPYHTTPGLRNGITWSIGSDGSITANGTAGTGGSFFYIAGSVAKVHLHSGKTYFLSGTPTVNSWKMYLVAMGDSGSFHYYRADLGSGGTFTPDSDQLLCFAYVDANVTVENYTFYPQIEEGTSATSFDIVSRVQDTISLGNTYYGGEIDLATGLMTVTRKKIQAVAGTSPAIQVANGIAACIVSTFESAVNNNDALACTRFPTVNNYNEEGVICRNTGFYSIRCQINMSRLDLSSAADPSNPTMAEVQAAFATWLAANPMDIVFQPVNMPTVQLSPLALRSLVQPDKYVPRLNTVYTDADSIQISYLKSPIRDEYEKTQAILSLGGNS